MLADGQGGIDCGNCNYKITKTKRDELEKLARNLRWNDGGDVLCPECLSPVTFEDYIDG